MNTYTEFLRKVRGVGSRSAVLAYHDSKTELTPDNYDGDGEAFQFDWIEYLRQIDIEGKTPTEDHKEAAKEAYLAAFWYQIGVLNHEYI